MYDVFPVRSGATAFRVPFKWLALACAVVAEFVSGQVWDYDVSLKGVPAPQAPKRQPQDWM